MAAQRLGRYRLEQVIGVGSFATVYRAVDERLEDTVVVKLLAENHSLNPEIRERFITEGRSLRKVASPHVVTVHDIGESDRQQPFLVLEYADRGTLADRVARLRAEGWRATPADMLAVARALAAAIDAVHSARLVHRDLSPGNVLLTTAPAAGSLTAGQATGEASAVVRPDERLLVADLGMCKDLALNSGLTVAGGTSGFRPPEQDGPGTVDTRADLWAMSQLMLWLGAGGDLPAELATALRRSTVIDPEDRHPDVATWLTDVEESLAPPPPATPEPPSTPEPPPAGAERPDHVSAPLPVAAYGLAATSAEAGARAVLTAPTTGSTAPGKAREEGSPATAPRPPRRRPGRAGVAALVLAALALGALGGRYAELWLSEGSRPPTSAEGASVAIEGAGEVAVGEEVTFTADVEGVDSWVWTLPTGAHILDEEEVSITARSPGTADVVLRARAPDGTHLEAVHTVRVTGP